MTIPPSNELTIFDCWMRRANERKKKMLAHQNRIAELEQALRYSTEVMETVLVSSGTSGWRYLRGQIDENKRILGGGE